MPRSKKGDSLEVRVLDTSGLVLKDKTTGQFSQRYPRSFLEANVRDGRLKILDAIEGGGRGAKNPNPGTPLGNSEGGVLTDPYSQNDKRTFEDIMMTDGTALEALMLNVKFVLGKTLQTVTDARRYYATEELRKQAVESIISNQEYQNVLVQVKEIDRKVKLQERLMGAQLQKYAYGRAALGVVLKNGLPTDLKPLTSKNLGNVYVDPKTWAFKGVEYHDNLVNEGVGKNKFLKAEELLYFTNMDYNLKADSLYYGVSKLKPVIGLSTAKRIIIDEDLPETFKGLWAAKGLLPLPGVTSQSKMNSIVNGLDPAKITAVNAEVGQPIIFPSSDKIMELVNSIPELDKSIIRAIGVPLPLMSGYEDVTNRATMDVVIQAFMETRAEFERTVLQSQLDSQWYDTLIGALTGKNPDELEYRICLEFQNLVFDTFKDKAEALKLVEEAGIPLTEEFKLEFLGWDNALEDMEQAREEQEEEEQRLMAERKEQFEKMQQQNPNPNTPPPMMEDVSSDKE